MAEKTAAEMAKEKVQADRDSIKVSATTTEPEAKTETEDKDETETETETSETEVTEKETSETETEVEETNEQIEQSEKTEEELKAEKAAATTQKEKDRVQKKIDKEVGRRKAAEEKVKELEAKLAAVPDADKVLTEADVETRAEAKANQKRVEDQFVADCQKLNTDATKADKDFKKKVDAMADDIGPIPGQMIGILADFDNGGAVLSYLVNNVDEAEEIYELKANPAKLALKLKDISIKVAKPKERQISKTNDPIEPIGGSSNKISAVPKDSDNMDVWMEKRNRQAREHAERKKAGMR